MKKLIAIFFCLLVPACFGTTLINSFWRSGPVYNPPSYRQYQSILVHVNEGPSVQFQAEDGYYLVGSLFSQQYQTGYEFVNKKSSARYQSEDGFQN